MGQEGDSLFKLTLLFMLISCLLCQLMLRSVMKYFVKSKIQNTIIYILFLFLLLFLWHVYDECKYRKNNQLAKNRFGWGWGHMCLCLRLCVFKSYRSRGDLKILHSFGFFIRGTVKLKIQYNENRNIMSFFWGGVCKWHNK